MDDHKRRSDARQHNAPLPEVTHAPPDHAPRVYILARKVLVQNTRIFKQAKSLTAAGYDVSVIGIKPRSGAVRERRDGYTIIRLELDPIHVRVPRRLQRAVRRLERALLRLPARIRAFRARLRVRPLLERRVGRLRRALRRRLSPTARGRLRRLRYRLERRGRITRLSLRRRRRAARRVLGRARRLLFGERTFGPPPRPRAWRRGPHAILIVALRALGRGLLRAALATIRAAERRGERRLRGLMRRFGWPSRSLAYYHETWRIVTTELPPPDLVHANDLDTLYVAARLARRYRVPLLYDAQELYTAVHTLPRWYRALLSVQEFLLLRRVDRVTVVNDAIAGVMQRRYRRKVDGVVLNCPPYEADVRAADGPSLRELFSLPDDLPVLIYSGGFSPRRGIENTLLSLKYIPAASLVLLGDGALRPALEELIARERLSDRVFFCDFVPHQDVPRLISSADVGIVPYENVGMNHYLGSPSKLFHYIMAELPVACSDFPFLRSVVGTYGLGAVFDPSDPRGIAQAVSRIVSDRDRHQAIKRNLSVAKRRYCWEIEEERLLAVYRSLVEPAAPSEADEREPVMS